MTVIGGPADERQEPAPDVVNLCHVDAHDRLSSRIRHEQDDVLATIQLVEDDPALQERLWAQLVDLLVESAFVDLRRDHLTGELDQAEYQLELADLAERCRSVGLLPLPSRAV